MHQLLVPIARGYAGSCRYGTWKGHEILDCSSDPKREDGFRGKLVVYIVAGDTVFSGWIPAEEFTMLDPKPWKRPGSAQKPAAADQPPDGSEADTGSPGTPEAPKRAKRLSLKASKLSKGASEPIEAPLNGTPRKRERLSLKKRGK